MAIPPSRRARATRAHPVSDENAVPSLTAARAARSATANGKDNVGGLRARAGSAGPSGKAVLQDVTSKATSTTSAKKRTALGPVTNVGESRLGGIKEEGEEGLKKPASKTSSTTTTSRTTLLARQRAASAAGAAARPATAEGSQSNAIRPPTRRTRSNTATAPAQKPVATAPVSDIPEEAQEDGDADAMEIDPPEAPVARPQVPRRVSARLSAATTSTTSIPSTKSTSTAASAAARQPLRARTTSAIPNGIARPIAGNAAVRRSKVLVAPRPVIAQPAVEDEEQDEGAPVKKRRTSSIDADENDAQPRHPRARVLENVVVTKREVKRKTVAHAASGSQSTVVSKEKTIQRQVEVLEPEPVIDEKWEDLDEQDNGDPMMVSEYADEIFEYMKRCELTNMPNPNYMDTQKELTWKFRDVLVDWLVQVHGSFRMLPETLFLCINLVDRFLSVRVVSLVKFQLVGVAALYLAAKYEEMHYPTVSDLVKCCDAGYDEKAILQAEAYILKSVGFDMSYPGPMSFLRRASKADDYDINSRTLAKYFIEMASLDWNLIDVTPSLASAASIWLARRILHRGSWTSTLVHYAGYTEADILPVAHKMVSYVLRERDEGIQHEHFAKKYSRKVYNKARQFIQEWARGLTKMNLQQFDRMMTVEGY